MQVVKFNPWFFSGTDQLMRFFFDELAAQLREERGLKDKLKSTGRSLAERLGRYSSALSPLKFIPGASAVLEGTSAVAEGASKLLGEEETSVHHQRTEITALLADLPGRIVVFVDDIDRLERQEIRDLFRLVRLTGSFPNIVYFLCFDRTVVETALTDGAVEGSAYLEKIVKVAVDVPPLPTQALTPIIGEGLAQVLEGVETGPFDRERWSDVLVQLILPMFATIRDVKRYLASVSLAARSAGSEVALVDVLALEALRVRYPAAHDLLTDAVDLLTGTTSIYGRRGTEPLPREQTFVDEFTRLSNGRASTVIRLLFPAAERLVGGANYGPEWGRVWERERRVASVKVLDYYLHRQLPPGRAPSWCIDHAAGAIGDQAALTDTLEQVPRPLLDDVLKRLTSHVQEATADQVLPTAAALLSQLPRVRLGSTGMMSPGGEWAVLGPVNALLGKLVADDGADQTVRSLFDGIPNLYGKTLLLGVAVGGSDHRGIVSEDAGRTLKETLRAQLLATAPEDLASERMLLRTIVAATGDIENPEPLEALSDGRVVARVLESAMTPVHSQTMGSVAVRTEMRLAWDPLATAFGGETALAGAVADLRRSLDDGTVELTAELADALALYERYATGWRPDF